MGERLEAKRAIVTGAASGIGRATAVLFAAEGAKVVLCDCNGEAGRQAARKIGLEHVLFLDVDVTDEKSVQAMVRQAVKWLGGLDILVNNAGVGGVGLPKPLAELSLETWDQTINANLKGTYLVSKYCLPHMVSAGAGSIVNLVSTYSIVGGPGLGAYCASKGGILALTRNMAVDYASSNVRVNAIAPGFVDTPMLRDDIQKDPDPEAALADIVARIPQGVLETSEEVAKVILFLASDDSRILTGSLVVADGGYTAR
jgi:NAD(P)-dependent dehydrogenase (short-subunit alcohol dehydrogenase family)